MTAKEMSDRMDIILNSYREQRSFGSSQSNFDFTLNEYEKSLFLTRAEYEIVRRFSLGKSANPFLNSFEVNEEMRRALDSLVKESELTNITSTLNPPTSNNSYTHTIYKTPEKCWYIVYERVTYNTDECICSEDDIDVIPVRHDELKKYIKNPFRKPNKNRVYRLDIDNQLELVSSYPLQHYIVRYIMKPNPIITANLPIDVSIEGENTIKDCELNTVLHDLIVETACQLAVQTKSVTQTEQRTNS